MSTRPTSPGARAGPRWSPAPDRHTAACPPACRYLLEGLEPLLEPGGQHEVTAASQRGQLLPQVGVLAQRQLPETHVGSHGPRGPGRRARSRGRPGRTAGCGGSCARRDGQGGRLSALRARRARRSGGRPRAARIPQAEDTWPEGGGRRRRAEPSRAEQARRGAGGRGHRRPQLPERLPLRRAHRGGSQAAGQGRSA